MKKIIYYKSDSYDSYSMDIKDIPSNHPLGYLAEFLIRDLRDNYYINSFIEWLEERKDDSEFDGTGFPMYQTLLEYGIVDIGPKIYDVNGDRILPKNTSLHFKTTRKKMIDILNRYKEAIAIIPYPNKIVFMQDDNGDFSIHPED